VVLEPPSSVENAEFTRLAEPFRRELRAHCYRMLGSVEEAEDALQETYLRAWRAYGRFERRSSLRVWLYRIATNACLTALQQASRRGLPSGLAAPSDDPGADASATGPEGNWLEPIPDALITPESEDPAAVAEARASVRLALIASLQYLPARQRAVVILRDVVGLPTAEVSEMLDTSTAAVKSALQRARARLEQVAPRAEDLAEPSEPRALELLNQYVAAFEQAELPGLHRPLSRCRRCLPHGPHPGEWTACRRGLPPRGRWGPAGIRARRTHPDHRRDRAHHAVQRHGPVHPLWLPASQRGVVKHRSGPASQTSGQPGISATENGCRSGTVPACRQQATPTQRAAVPAPASKQDWQQAIQETSCSPREACRAGVARRPDWAVYWLMVSPAVAEIVGDCRPWTVLTISALSMPWR
jgi:RNA polymerase sigma-70 factor (TIGR02960 family)